MLTVNDPCVSPDVSITVPNEESHEYYITTPEMILPFYPRFAVDPSFCDFELTSEVIGDN